MAHTVPVMEDKWTSVDAVLPNPHPPDPQLLGWLGTEGSQLRCSLGILVSWREPSPPKSFAFLGTASIQQLVSGGVSIKVQPSYLKSRQHWGAIPILKLLVELTETFVVTSMMWYHLLMRTTLDSFHHGGDSVWFWQTYVHILEDLG